MKEGIHYMPSHNVNGISFDNMTCLLIMNIVKISSHMKGHTQAQKRSCLLVESSTSIVGKQFKKYIASQK